MNVTKVNLVVGALWAAALVFTGAGAAFAGNDISDLANNIETSISNVPGLIAAFSYLLGVMFGIAAILKIRDHVENPHQTPLREGLIRALAGGALFSLPMVYEVVRTTIGAGGGLGAGSTTLYAAIMAALSVATGQPVTGLPLLDFNHILFNIQDSLGDVPGLIAGVSYLLGLIIGVSAVLKMKEHVDSPQQTALRESVIRFLIAGALLSLPIVLEAARELINPGGRGNATFLASLGLSGMFLGTEARDTAGLPIAACGLGFCLPILGCFGAGTSIGMVMCNIVFHTSQFPTFLLSMAYLFGLIMVVWGILKIKDHVLEPRQTTVWEGVARLVAGGAFFALPAVIGMVTNTLGTLVTPHFNTGFSGTPGAGGLDSVMTAFMRDIMAPANVLINFFGVAAGMVFIMIGISRLIKSAQEGPRGPGGLGTMTTFLIGGALVAFSPMITAASTSMFGGSGTITTTSAALQYTAGMTAAEVDHAHSVISAILRFMIVLGLISFMRGLFIIRGVAEGSSQASMMAGVTHIIGGALAVNLGPLMNAVQTTLGLTGFGVMFS